MAEPEVTRIPIKTLTKMMVAGQNQVVMKYLRTLPSEECAEIREQLIKNLELIQQQQKKTGSGQSGSTSKSSDKTSGGTSSRDKSGGTTGRRTNKNVAGGTGSTGHKDAAPKLTITTHSDGEDKGLDRHERPQVGNYVYMKDLGKGQFGVVYKAKHITSGLKVAIKEIDSDQVSATSLPGIMKEAEVMSNLAHVNILKIFEVIKTKKRIYFVLDYINRGSLLQLIKTAGVFPDEVAAYFVKQSAEGLKYLHEQHSIIHRDIKCANLLLTQEGVIKLADFGTAKEDAGKSFTVIGTPFWMAPEIIEVAGANVVSDIWSMGCTLVEMLKGTPPYFELATMQALFKIVEDPHPPIPPNFSDDVKVLLKTYCFVKDVKKRATAATLLKLPWVNRYGDKLFTYDQLVSMIKKEDPNNSTGRKKLKGSTGININISNSNSGSKLNESPKSNNDINSQVLALQLEIEKLALEQSKLQKELDTLLGNS